MMFEEPKVEVVEIETDDVIATSAGSYENCVGPDAPMNNCDANGVFMS
jgi:hypothetical protein